MLVVGRSLHIMYEMYIEHKCGAMWCFFSIIFYNDEPERIFLEWYEKKLTVQDSNHEFYVF